MAETTAPTPFKNCSRGCQTTTSFEELNRACFCLSLDEPALRRALEAAPGVRGLSRAMLETHPHLFASVPMFVSRAHLARMAEVVRAVNAVVATPRFRDEALAWAPDIARYDPGSHGGLLGYDFHLADSGPQLIEINTNPGGALLNTVMARAHRSCCVDASEMALAPMEADAAEEALFESFMAEWRLQRGASPLRSIAIVDKEPASQYLYPEFLLYRQLFESHGVAATICDPCELSRKDARLWHGNKPIDFIYNRLTDFGLAQPVHEVIKLAYLAKEVVVSPHPRAHALYADKRNLTLLCNEDFLRQTGIDDSVLSTLLAAIPRTEILTDGNRDAMWTQRRAHFFKPATAYGSKAAYRGDKLTKRVWEEMTRGTYVVQALVTPSERRVAGAPQATVLKADIRNYAYAGRVMLVAARLYQGQTTNFRTPAGGFAPVFTEKS